MYAADELIEYADSFDPDYMVVEYTDCVTKIQIEDIEPRTKIRKVVIDSELGTLDLEFEDNTFRRFALKWTVAHEIS